MTELLTVCEHAARLGGEVLRQWQGRFVAREKGPADLVTQADLESQQAIAQVVRDAFPEHAFVGEESEDGAAGPPPDAAVCWVVDPLDGTTNYVHGLKPYCVSVGVVDRGRIEAGVVYDPLADECYAAQRGRGATLNGRPLRTSQVTRIDDALLAAGFPPQKRIRPSEEELATVVRLSQSCQAVRRLGSSAMTLCYLAAGHLDAYWDTRVRPWDVAAGVLLVTEAGGVVTAPDGQPFDLWNPQLIAAAGPGVHGQVVRRVGPAGP